MRRNKNLVKIILVSVFMFVGILVLKFLPMKIFGPDILFDASLHLTATILILYSIWLFIEHEKKNKLFLIGVIIVTALVSLQRILVQAHDIAGLLGGYFISLASIGLAEYFVSTDN